MHCIALLILSLRDCSRRMRLIRLSNVTLLDDSHARLIAGALRSLMNIAAVDEPESLEMHQMVFQPETRTELLRVPG